MTKQEFASTVRGMYIRCICCLSTMCDMRLLRMKLFTPTPSVQWNGCHHPSAGRSRRLDSVHSTESVRQDGRSLHADWSCSVVIWRISSYMLMKIPRAVYRPASDHTCSLFQVISDSWVSSNWGTVFYGNGSKQAEGIVSAIGDGWKKLN